MTMIRRRSPRVDLVDWPAGLHPVVRQVLSRRDVDSRRELELGLSELVPVGQFEDLDAAVAVLVAHRDSNVVVVGDFDADGATSTALMLLALRRLGFSRVSHFIPDRFELGYGLSAGAVAAIKSSAPGLIVTVDNGISSVEGVAAARSAGFRVLITDHHLPPDELPDADAIVNPNLPGGSFSGKNLAGVGVAFYLIAALGRRLGEPTVAAEYLDLVALGTVADLVTLDHSNRILVEQGLRRIRARRCRPGLLALCEIARIDPRHIVAASLGFQIGPRLNAAGRLDDMSLGVRCLVTESRKEAEHFAATLDRLNKERRQIESRMKAEALRQLDEAPPEASGDLPAVLCLADNGWHEGVVGLIASRLKDRYHRPTFAFAPSGGDMLKGSGRSVAGFHLRDALADVNAREPGLIDRFGGHAMAAGLSLARKSLPRFIDLIQEVSRETLERVDGQAIVWSDGPLEPAHLTLSVAALLRDAGPWGQGFPEPCFDDEFELTQSRVLKDAHLKLRLRHADGASVEAIAFNSAECDWPVGAVRRIAYRLDVNDYFQEPRLQLVVQHIEDAESQRLGSESLTSS